MIKKAPSLEVETSKYQPALQVLLGLRHNMRNTGEEKSLFSLAMDHTHCGTNFVNTCCAGYVNAKMECSKGIVLYAGCL